MNKSQTMISILMGFMILFSVATHAATTKYSLSVTKTGSGTISSSPSGISCGTRCSTSFSSGAVVTLWTTPAPGYAFMGWGGDCSGTGNCVLTMRSKKSVSAKFERNTGYTISVTKTGNGLITSAPSGINCGATCAYTFSPGNTVTLWTTPDSGYRFSGWSGDCTGTGDCVLNMNAPKSITASFVQSTSYPLVINKTGNGKVTSVPAGIDCGIACSSSFAGGTNVTLTATADPGYGFTGWSGACSGSGSCTVTMDAAKNITATFSGSPPPTNLPDLKRGINLSHWLTHYGRQPVVKADMISIKNAGFDHVRIPFDPAYLGWNPDNLANAGSMPQISSLDAAVDLAINNGLVAVVDFHPGSSLKSRIETESSVQDAYIKLWTSLAERYQGKPQSSLVYELLNEPQYWNNGPAAWYVLRQKALTAVRSKDTQHLILLSGGYGGGLRGILEDPALTDSAVGYTFHYYQPYLFTHNGAPWEPHLSQVEDTFTGLRYPAALNTMGNIKPKTGADLNAITTAFNDYISQNWAYQRILSDVASVKTWATSHGSARVYCNEFGVLRLTQDEASRSSYLKDVRTAVESGGMGWTVFDYADIFGIAKATGSTYLSGDGAIIPSDPGNPNRVFTTDNLDALVK